MTRHILQQREQTAGQRHRSRATALAAAVAAPLAVWAVVRFVLGIEIFSPEFGPEQPSKPVGAIHVVGTAGAASVAGWALLSALERFTARARTIWTLVATGVLAVSLGGPFGGDGIGLASQYTLVAMHLTVGAVLIPGLRATAREPGGAGTPRQEAQERQSAPV